MHSANTPINLPLRAVSPALLDGPSKGVPESRLLIKYAADKQQAELSLLLKNGQDPNVMHAVEWQQFETTPLFEAAVNGYKRVVRLLIEHGAKVDTPVGPGLTPIYNAALNGHFEVTRLLVESGANVDVLTEAGFSPLYIACQEGHADCVVDILSAPMMSKELIDLAPPQIDGATALYVAAQNGHWLCVKLLLDAGCAVDPQRISCGSTPLMIAMFVAERDADTPHIKICEMLLQSGASLTLTNKAGHTVIEMAKDDNSLLNMIKQEVASRAREAESGYRGWY